MIHHITYKIVKKDDTPYNIHIGKKMIHHITYNVGKR